MKAEVVEGNYCQEGVRAVSEEVASGRRGPAVLFCDVRAICTSRQHTPTCVRLYHHHHISVPEVEAIESLNFLHRKKPPLSFVGLLLREAYANNGLKLLLRSNWQSHPGTRQLCIKRRRTLGCEEALLAAPLLSAEQAMALTPFPKSVQEDVFVRELKAYQSYLSKAPTKLTTVPQWAKLVLKTAKRGMHRLPLETQEQILFQVFPKDWVRCSAL